MSRKPLISIIIPTLNEEKWIGNSLKRLRSTIKEVPYEIIVSDGKSTDKTIKISKKLADKVIEYKNKKRQTISMGRNAGAEKAKGKYLVFIDTDAIIPSPDSLFKKAISEFEKDDRLGAIAPNIYVYPESETIPERILYFCLNSYHKIMNNLLGNGCAAGEFQMHRASIFKKLGGFKEDLVASEDYEMFGRISQTYKTRIVPDITVYHSGRRIKKVGLLKTIMLWNGNALSMFFSKKALSKSGL